MRGHFYPFKGVIRQHYEENVAPKPLDARTEDDASSKRVQRCLEKTSIWIDKDKLEARFIHRDQGRYGQMLARATISDAGTLQILADEGFESQTRGDFARGGVPRFAAACKDNGRGGET